MTSQFIDDIIVAMPHEFAATIQNCPAMRDAIARDGCFVLRGLFDPSAMARIRERVDFLARCWDYMIEHGYMNVAEHYVAEAFQAGKLPETHIGPEETWRDLLTGNGALYDEIVNRVFGASKPRDYSLRRSVLAGSNNPLPWHQDGYFLGAAPTYNFWTPLQEVGVDAPGLEVVIGSGPPIVMRSVPNARVDEYVDRTYGPRSFWLPTLKAGDVLVLTSVMFHRTQSSPQTVKARYSLEIRGAIQDRTLKIAGTPADWSEIAILGDVPE